MQTKKLLALIVSILLLLPVAFAKPPTPSAFGGTAKLDGADITPGTLIQAYDPDSIQCGNWTHPGGAIPNGQYGPLNCAGDDPDTAGIDEGAEGGDKITFYINGWEASLAASATTDDIWTEGGTKWYTNIEAEEGCISNDNCSHLDTACADGVCTNNECEQQFKVATTVCRASAGDCDLAETCTGSSATCPADAKSSAECRAAVDECDTAESCDGSSNDCPAADGKAPAGTQCAQARDCPDDACGGANNYFAMFYPNDGHDTCDGNGNCEEYSCALENQYCTDNYANDGVNNLQCSAPCDQDGDCSEGYVCNLESCQCIESQCLGKDDGTSCDDGLYCDGADECQNEVCVNVGPAVNCNDNVGCTDDSCNETTDSCQFIPNWHNCDDGVGCTDDICDAQTGCSNPVQHSACDDGNECTTDTCHSQNDCQYSNKTAGTQCGQARDCPDDACGGANNYFAQFYPDDGHDTCDGSGSCTQYSCALENQYCTDNNPNDGVNNLQCGAECDQNTDCADNECEETYNDYCNQANNNLIEYDDDKVKDSTTVEDSCGNTCENDCTCTDCAVDCSAPSTNEYCVEGLCEAVCDEDSDCDDEDPTTFDICENDCTCTNTREICDDGQDNDQDGDTDCADSDCAGQQGQGGVACCQNNDDCNNLDDDCAQGICDANNECQQQFKPATTVCSQKNGACDIEEKCTGNTAACPADAVEPTTTECRGTNNNPCDVAENCDGQNKDCPADAFKVAGDDCGTCAACDGAGTCGYDETQDNDCDCPADECTDENNDCVIDAYNDYIDGECEALFQCKDCGPTTITEPDARCNTTMKIPIDEGISMFSLPLIPAGGTTTFNAIQNGCNFPEDIAKGIAYWNPLKTPESEYEYIHGDDALYPGQGYFTTQNNSCDFTIGGYKFNMDCVGYLGTNNLHLGTGKYTGWNQIGAPSDTVNNFDTVTGTCNIVDGPWIYNNGWTPTKKVEPGKAYYVKTTNNCNLG